MCICTEKGGGAAPEMSRLHLKRGQQHHRMASAASLVMCCCSQAFIYLAGLQLCLSSGVRSLTAAGAGLLAGLLYRANLFGMRKWKVGHCTQLHSTHTKGHALRQQIL